MDLLKLSVDWFLFGLLKMPHGTLLVDALNFFLYETIKIFLLLFVIIYTVSIIRTFFSSERTRQILSHEKKYFANILASLLGIVTPFCSCSAVPLFLGFLEAGVPLGVTFSFLVASPMINEVALVLLWGLFGWKVALIYIGSGLAIATLSGLIIGRLRVEQLVESDVVRGGPALFEGEYRMSGRDRMEYARTYTRNILQKIWPYVIAGIGVGAWIHGFIPTDFLVQYAGRSNWLAVPIAVLIGIPLYSNAAGVIPLVSVLVEKGVGMGTALAFMMAVTALSLPEFMILRKVMKVRLILIFASAVGLGIIFTGYLFNWLL